MNSSLSLQKGKQVYQHLDFSPVRPASGFGPIEVQGNKCGLFEVTKFVETCYTTIANEYTMFQTWGVDVLDMGYPPGSPLALSCLHLQYPLPGTSLPNLNNNRLKTWGSHRQSLFPLTPAGSPRCTLKIPPKHSHPPVDVTPAGMPAAA